MSALLNRTPRITRTGTIFCETTQLFPVIIRRTAGKTVPAIRKIIRENGKNEGISLIRGLLMSSRYFTAITISSTNRDSKSKRLIEVLGKIMSLPLLRLSINKTVAKAVTSEDKRKITLNSGLFQIRCVVE